MEGPISTSRDLVQLEDAVRSLSKDDGRSRAEGASSTIAKERSKIEALRRRNDKLHAELMGQTDPAKAATSLVLRERDSELHSLQDEADELRKRIEVEKRRCGRYEEEARKAHVELMTRTGTMDAVTVTTANNRLIDRKIKSLENELERQLQAVNDTFARNKDLRSRIDGLRRERAVQDALYTEMARELRRNTVLIKRGGEEADRLEERANRVCSELDALEARSRKAEASFERRTRRLQEDLAKGKQALGITRQEERDAAEAASDEEEDEEGGGSSLELDEALFSSSGLAKRGEGTGDSGDTSPAPAFPHAARIGAGESATQGDAQGAARQSLALMQTYEEVFAKIRAHSGVSSLDELSALFIEEEQRNFSTLKYVNELASEVEAEEEAVGRLHAQLEALRSGEAESTATYNSRASLAASLRRKIREARRQEREAARDLEQQEALLGRAATAVGELHALVTRAVRGKGGGDARPEVTDTNILSFLAMIEHRARALLGLRDHAPLQRAQSMAVTHAAGAGVGDTESLPQLPFASPLDWRPGTPTRRSPHPTPPPSRSRTPGAGKAPADGFDGTVPEAESSPERTERGARGGRTGPGAGATRPVPVRAASFTVEPPSVGSPRVHTLSLHPSARGGATEGAGTESQAQGVAGYRLSSAAVLGRKPIAQSHGQRSGHQHQHQHQQASSSDSEDSERPLTVDELHTDATEALRRANDEAVQSYNAKRRRQRTLAPSHSEVSLQSPGWVA